MSGNKRVLIIDDEIDLCLLLKDYFVRKNYNVAMAHTLTEGLTMLQTDTPDILFLDNNLPDGIGWILAPDLASAYPSVYIVLISAFHPAVPDMPAGAKYRMIEKPISMGELDKQFAEL